MNELEHLRARADVHDLLVRLAQAQDTHDWETLTDCFAADATYDHPGGRLEGAAAIVERSSAALGRLDGSQHLVGSFLIDVDGDDATCTSYFQAQHVKRGTPGGDLLIIAGTYRDRLRRTGSRWQVVHRTQEYSWRDGNAEVTKRPTPPESPS
jgi:hypothetical protein